MKLSLKKQKENSLKILKTILIFILNWNTFLKKTASRLHPNLQFIISVLNLTNVDKY